MNKMIIFSVILMSISPMVQASELAQLKKEGKDTIKALAGSLGKEMKQAMKKGGPTAAIGVCNAKANPIAQEVSKKQGIQIGRTSLKLRNPKNAPDAWEKAALMDFDKRAKAGESPKGMVTAEIVQEDGKRTFRMIKAIGLKKQCLGCHGASINPKVAKTLNQLYPKDQARDYVVGQIRGAFTLKKVLN